MDPVRSGVGPVLPGAVNSHTRSIDLQYFGSNGVFECNRLPTATMQRQRTLLRPLVCQRMCVFYFCNKTFIEVMYK